MTSVPRPEYPRPQMVREDWLNLNGQWEFEMDPGCSGEARGMVTTDKPYAQEITVPFCPESVLSGIGHVDFMPSVWYRRNFTIPSDWKNKKVILHFGAVDYEARVWLNGQYVGKHLGGYSSFSFDITSYLKDGENTVVVYAIDDTRSGLQPTGKQSVEYYSSGCEYTRTTGIWQTVWLEAVPVNHINSFKLYPNLDAGSLTVIAKISGNTDGITLKAKATASGKVVGEASVPAHSPSTFTINLSEVHPWEPGNGYLYDLDIVLEKDGKPIDVIKSYFGLRSIRIDGKKVLINNKSVFQRLVLDQGFYPDGIYTAPNDEALKKDIELSYAMGFNGARLHEKIFEPRFLYWADKMGYLVWGEYPNWGLDHAHPNALERVLPEWLEALDRDFNHPSIIGWAPFNETTVRQNHELLRNAYRVTKAIDPTRPVIDTSGYVHVETDIWDSHNYEQDPDKFAKIFDPFKTSEKIFENFEQPGIYKGEPYFVSEYGGIWWNPGDNGGWGYGNRPRSEEEFLDRYKRLTEYLLFHPKMFGFCYTELYDVEQEVNGLYTYDRKPKFDPEIIRKINIQKAAIED